MLFTGIVQTLGRVAALEPAGEARRLRVRPGDWPGPAPAPGRGDSVCVSGVCLTVAETDGRTLCFDVVPETLAKTTLGALAEGDAVNLELPVTPSQPLGGHFVQGHVEATAAVLSVEKGDDWRVDIAAPETIADAIVPKGSIAVEGVSLTVASASAGRFAVALIPTTLAETTLGALEPGARVNVETDMLARAVVHALERRGSDEGA